MKKYLFASILCFSFLITGSAFAQDVGKPLMPTEGDSSELPEYGEVPKTSEQKLADDKFLREMESNGWTKEDNLRKMLTSGWDYLRDKRPKSAIRCFNRAWLLNPIDYHVYWGFASCVYMLHDYDATIKWFTKARVLSADNNAKLLCDFGRIYNDRTVSASGKERDAVIGKAIDLFAKAARVDPNMEQIYSYWAIALDNKRDYQGACDMIDKATKLGGKTIDSKFLEHLRAESFLAARHGSRSVAPVDPYLHKIQALLAERCKFQPALEKGISVEFYVDGDGQIKAVQVSQGSQGSEEENKAARQILEGLKKVPPPPAEVKSPLWLSADLWNSPHKISVALRDIEWKSYISEVQYWIKKHWAPQRDSESRSTKVVFYVLRDGNIEDLKISKSSGVASVDQEALKTVQNSVPFLPLPEGVSNRIGIEFSFDYNVDVPRTQGQLANNLFFSEFVSMQPLNVTGSDDELNQRLMALDSVFANRFYHAPSGKLTHEPSKPLTDVSTMDEVNQWVTYYYIYPQPEFTTRAIFLLEKNGLLDDRESRAFSVAFIARMFAQHPEKLQKWVQDLKSLEQSHKSFVWTALWLANTSESMREARVLKEQLSSLDQSIVECSVRKQVAVEDMKVKSANILEMLWGSFMATGDERYVNRIIEVLPISQPTASDLRNNAMQVIIALTARWGLISNAIQHKRVLAICTKDRDTMPQFKDVLTEILDKVNEQLQNVNGPKKMQA